MGSLESVGMDDSFGCLFANHYFVCFDWNRFQVLKKIFAPSPKGGLTEGETSGIVYATSKSSSIHRHTLTH
jgi:hypothetical protein